MKHIRVRLITLLLGLPQRWCDIRIWFSIRLYGPIKALSYSTALDGGISVLWTQFFSSFIFTILNTYVSLIVHAKIQPKISSVLEKKLILLFLLFLYVRLKNGRIMLYPWASVRLSVCKLFRFRVTPPTVYVRLSWTVVYSKTVTWFNACYLEVMVQRFLAELQTFN